MALEGLKLECWAQTGPFLFKNIYVNISYIDTKRKIYIYSISLTLCSEVPPK